MASSNQRVKGITIEIGGDTTKLSKALEGVNKTIKSTQSALKDVNSLLKLDPGNTDLLKQKQQLLNKEVEATKEKLQQEKEALEQLKNASDSDKTVEQQQALQREIIATTQELEKLKKEASDSASVLGTQMQLAGEKIQNVGGAISSAGEKMLPATAAVAAVGTAAVKTAASFDSSMSQVAATMGFTVSELSDETSNASKTMNQLSEFAQQMGATTAFSASEAAEALNFMALAGYDAETSMKMLPTVLDLAAAGGMELATASDMVTDTQSALGLSIEQTKTMVDQMAKASSKSNTSVSQLGDALLTIGATAANCAGGTKELTTVLGVLADNGIKGSEGGTHLRNMILSLQNAAEDGKVAMGDLSISVYDADGNMRNMIDIISDMQSGMEGMTQESKDALLTGIFNKTDLSSVNALLATSQTRFDELGNAIGNSTGAASDMAAVQLNNLEGQLTLLKSALEGLAISVGSILMPYVTQIVEKVQGLVDWLNSLDDSQKQIVVTIALVVAAIGPVLIVIGKVISAVGTVVSTGGIVLTFIQGSLIPAISTIATTLIGTVIPAIVAFVAAFWPVIAVVALVVAAIVGVIAVIKNWGAITEWFQEKWAALGEKVASIKDTFLDLVEQAKDWGKDMIDNFINGITEKYEKVKEAVGGVAETIASYIHFSEPDVGPLSNFHTFMPDMMNELAKGIQNNIGVLNKPMTELASAMVPGSSASTDLSTLTNLVGTYLPNMGQTPVNVVLQGDAAGVFKLVQNQNKSYKKSTGRSAF